MRIATIVGARPQFVKAAVLSRLIAQRDDLVEIMIHTGQHYDDNMSAVFFEQLAIPRPRYNLNIHQLSHGAMTGRMMEQIEVILVTEAINLVIVFGDTNSTLAGALAAKKLHIPVAHVEAGLRSYNMNMPEEINRIITDRISNFLFCPTQQAVDNLKKEGFDHFNCKIVQSGDIMLDAILFNSQKWQKPAMKLPENYLLCTVHRVENVMNDLRLKEIFDALTEISLQVPTVMPIHPATQNKLNHFGLDFQQSNIIFIDPVGYFEMGWLLQHCSMVLTDSGGLQKEAYFFNKKCLILRKETEWTELVDLGTHLLCPGNCKQIVDRFTKLISKKPQSTSINLYGDGHAGEKILSACSCLF